MASPRKPCKKCKKQIPAIALDCVFCGAKQEAPPLEELLPAALTRAKETAARVEAAQAEAQASGTDLSSDFADSFSTEPTLVGLKVADLAALGIGAPQPSKSHQSESSSDSLYGDPAPSNAAKSVFGDPVQPQQAKGTPPPSTKVTQAMQAVQPAPKAEPADGKAAAKAKAEPTKPEAGKAAAKVEAGKSAEAGAAARPMPLSQTVSIGAGALLIVLFFLPWGGATSWQLLEHLGGRQFIRQFWYLAGGLTLVAAGGLPVPAQFRRVAIAAFAAPLVLGGFTNGILGGILQLTALVGALLAASSERKLARNVVQSLYAIAGLAAAALVFVVPGHEMLHVVGWLAATAVVVSAARSSEWNLAARSTAN